MNIQNISDTCQVRRLNHNDLEAIYLLCCSNPAFYQYHPPFVTRESILEDMSALPPGKNEEDKYYIGFWKNGVLTALMDLISAYPERNTAYIGFFMVHASSQGQGIGSTIINEAWEFLSKSGFTRIRLAVDQGNPQSEGFWSKNGFRRTGESFPWEQGCYIVMEKVR
ncbi:MAG: GNAT family N-acetyltransferase [Acetatifactor sp.]|nr:GNAT family N-acetyltransferase [Acetatifactor sp.]